MQRTAIQRVLGILLMIISLSMLPPVFVSLWYDDGVMVPFILAFFTTLTVGILLWFPVRRFRKEMRLRDGFIIVAMYWLVLGLSGSLPLILSESPHLTITDAVFESISGRTLNRIRR